MLLQKYDPAAFTDEFGIRCRRLGLDELPIQAPFGSMWCSIDPGASSSPDTHDEAGMIVVVEGRGAVHVDGESVRVAAGDVVHVDPESQHVITNESDGGPLRVLSIYWPVVAPATDGGPADDG